MPELPEVQTIINNLNKARPRIIGAVFINVWTDAKKIIQKPDSFDTFKKQLLGLKISNIRHRGKNIIFELSEGKSLLIHQKLTGHLLYGKWQRAKSKEQGAESEWQPKEKGALEERVNKYIHLLFILNNNWMLALSDLRKFAKVELWNSEELKRKLKFLLGAEPLDNNFNFEKFQEALKNKSGSIKKILMDQKIIAGIGNIYSDEILWEAKVNPFINVIQLNDEELKRIFKAMKEVLKKGIELKGESISDYRRPTGQKGFFDRERKVYRREKQKCFRCGAKIERKKISGRSVHFCPQCQAFSQ